MYIRILTIGKPKISFAREGFAVYIDRLRRFHKVDVVHIDDGSGAEKKVLSQVKRDSRSCFVLFDEEGIQLSSPQMAKALQVYDTQGITHITFCIGGPDGHSNELKRFVQTQWSLSKLTLPHDLAMLFVSEALYRASTIIAGHPYHRL